MMPGMPERRSHDYVRNGITTLFAAFNIADGTVISELHRNHRAAEFKKFLTTIDKTVPEGAAVQVRVKPLRRPAPLCTRSLAGAAVELGTSYGSATQSWQHGATAPPSWGPR